MTDLIQLPVITPIELVRLPGELDGQTGENRAVGGRSQIAAQTDIDAIKAWLARFADTLTTFTSYRKEAERLLLWSVIELGKPFSSLTHEDLLVYQRFGGKQRPLTRSAVHLIVKEVFARASARIRQRGTEFERIATLLEDASAHWLRHTAGSNMAGSNMDLRHVRDNLGH